MQNVERFFEDYQIGTTRNTIGRTITETDIVVHAGQTGDFFPHHMDAEWCATQPFGQRVAHGTLTIAIAVGMTATEINPRSMSYGYDHVRFPRPVMIGDTITVRAEITDKRDHHKRVDSYGIVTEQVTVTNQRGETVLALRHLYLVDKRGDQDSRAGGAQ